jgi:hypothetical protein
LAGVTREAIYLKHRRPCGPLGLSLALVAAVSGSHSSLGRGPYGPAVEHHRAGVRRALGVEARRPARLGRTRWPPRRQQPSGGAFCWSDRLRPRRRTSCGRDSIHTPAKGAAPPEPKFVDLQIQYPTEPPLPFYWLTLSPSFAFSPSFLHARPTTTLRGRPRMPKGRIDNCHLFSRLAVTSVGWAKDLARLRERGAVPQRPAMPSPGFALA